MMHCNSMVPEYKKVQERESVVGIGDHKEWGQPIKPINKKIVSQYNKKYSSQISCQ